MRFSLKWIMAGMAYVAIAAAALGTGKWYFADVLWPLTLVAVIYAILLAVFASGQRRLAAAGFVVGCGCFLICVTFGNDAVPTERLLVAAGLDQSGQNNWVSYPPVVAYPAPAPQPAVATPLPSTPSSVGPVYYPPPYTVVPSTTVGYALPVQLIPGLPVRIRAANAIATLAFGLIGSLVGVIAFRAASAGAQGRHGVHDRCQHDEQQPEHC